jgi:hypothetical protein
MRLKTIRDHSNEHGESHFKNVGKIYEVKDEREAKRLISLGYVEKVDANSSNRRAKRSGGGAGGATEGDGA